MAKSIVNVMITGESRGAVEAFHRTQEAASETGGKLKTAGLLIGGAFVAAGVGAVAFGVDAVKSAMKGQVAHAQLAQAIKNSGGTWQQYGGRIDATSKQLSGFGYTNDQVQLALTQLTQATGDPKRALDNIGLAANIAKGRHIDLATASTLVGKVMAGNTTVLKRMGIDYGGVSGGAKAVTAAQVGVWNSTVNLNKVEQKIHDGRLKGKAATDALTTAQGKLRGAQEKLTAVQGAGAAAIAALNKRFGGDAVAASGTLQGKIDSLKAHFENWKEEIGNRLIPVVTDLATRLVNFATVAGPKVAQFANNAKQALSYLISGFQGAHDKGNGFLDVFQRVGEKSRELVDRFRADWPQIKQTISKTLMDVEHIVRDVVGTVEAIWRNFHTQIMTIVRATWNSVKGTVQGVLNVIEGIFRTVMAIIHGNWAQAWAGIKQTVLGVWQIIKASIGTYLAQIKATITGALHLIGTTFSGTWETVKTTTGKAWTSIKTAVTNGVNDVVKTVKALPGKARDALGNLGTYLSQKGKDLINGLKSGATTAWTAVASWFAGLPQAALNAIGDVSTKLSSIGSGLIHGIASGIAGAAHAVEDALHNIGISWKAKKVAGITVIPGGSIKLAEGGIARHRPGGIMANIGEGRYDEAVIPLSPSNLRGLSNGGGATVNVYVAGSVVTEQQLIDVVLQGLQAKQQKTVTLGLTGPKWRLAS